MEPEGGRRDTSLEEFWSATGREFELFQAVLLLERSVPRQSSVGFFRHPSRESIRFHTDYSMSCPPPNMVDSVQFRNAAFSNERQAHVHVRGFQLLGYSGVLPYFYAHLIDTVGKEFLDLFMHRFISLYYRAWQKHHPYTVAGTRANDRNRFPTYLNSLLKLRDGQSQSNSAILARNAGLMNWAPQSVTTLKRILMDRLEVPIEVEQFRPTTYRVSNADRARIGGPGGPGLGEGALLGSEIVSTDWAFRIHLGPLSPKEMGRFLPGSDGHRELVKVTLLVAGRSLYFDIAIIVRSASRLRVEGLSDDGEIIGMRLGWYSWLGRPNPKLVQHAEVQSEGEKENEGPIRTLIVPSEDKPQNTR